MSDMSYCSVFSAAFSLPLTVEENFNPFPHHKILDQTKLKAFSNDKRNKNDDFCL